MTSLEDSLYVARRTLEADFPRTADRVLQTAYVTAKAAPVIRNSVYWKAAEMAPGQLSIVTHLAASKNFMLHRLHFMQLSRLILFSDGVQLMTTLFLELYVENLYLHFLLDNFSV
ncbi:uncharacterized protein [Heptranchias perlo]|uniref:uncharacterized protein isoform X4 n=1 Tax=Heptranchias perlo TaxID=212740 RepID=UPI0035599BC0